MFRRRKEGGLVGVCERVGKLLMSNPALSVSQDDGEWLSLKLETARSFCFWVPSCCRTARLGDATRNPTARPPESGLRLARVVNLCRKREHRGGSSPLSCRTADAVMFWCHGYPPCAPEDSVAFPCTIPIQAADTETRPTRNRWSRWAESRYGRRSAPFRAKTAPLKANEPNRRPQTMRELRGARSSVTAFLSSDRDLR
jgi:hypothetical protein